MKPIFEEERLFFRERTGIDLPTDCWRDGSKIYLDCTQTIPLIKFKVEDKIIKIIQDNRSGYKKQNKVVPLPEQIKIPQLINIYNDEINNLWEESINETKKFIDMYKNYLWLVCHSGGKDSVILYSVFCEALKALSIEINWLINFANTSNDTADTYKLIKNLPKEKLKILNPEIGFYTWITKIKNYLIPNVLMRNCCSTYKEGQINKHYDKDALIIQAIGVRKSESNKRSKFKMVMDDDFQKELYGKNNMSKNWIRFAPIIDWKDHHIWLFMLKNEMEFNRQYKLGFNRCGCLICPYQSDYIDLLIEKNYPHLWNRWIGILKQSYEKQFIAENKKWSLEEYINGKWKVGISKVQELIQSKPNNGKIKLVAELQGITDNMAMKYFKKKCVCGKSLNPSEIAMFYKTFGRYEDIIEDKRNMFCKKCFCKETGISTKEYTNKVIQYTNEGCNLF